MKTVRSIATAGALVSTALVPIFAYGLEEVVVRAQRREQSLQDVPISVTAFEGAKLEQQRIKEASQYLQLAPNVSYTEDGQVGSRGLSISMRGVSNINTDESAFIQSIGIYLDEFSVASTANATINPQLIDLESVEVLRGPQGTYFGRNAVGGALNLTTKKPTDEFGFKISGGGHVYETTGEQYDVSAVINMPLTDTLSTRGVVFYEENTGIVENIVPGGGDSGHEYIMGRFTALWEPSDRASVNWMVMFTDEEQGLDENVPSGVWDTDTVATFFLNNPALGTFTSAQDDGTGFWPNNRDKVAHTAIGERNDNKAFVTVLNVTGELTDDVTIKSITGYLGTSNEKVFDNDLVPEDLVNRYQEKTGQSWSTELRFEMEKDKFDLIGGILFSEDKIKKTGLAGAPGGGLGVQTGVTTAVDGAASLAPVPGGNPDVPIVLPGVVDFALVGMGALPPLFELGPGFFLYNLTPDGMLPLCLACNLRKSELQSFAAFSDLTWHATDALDLTFGFRYTRDEVESRFIGLGLFRTPRVPNPVNPAVPVPFKNSDTFDDFSPRFVATYDINDDVSVYANISKGYKAGGFTLDFNTAPGAPNGGEVNERFDEETLWNYEAGIKSEWFDNRLRLNAAVFHLEWSDLQVETFFFTVPGDATSNIQRTINVEDAEATGFEVEFAATPLDRLLITGGVGYVDTEITSDDTARISGNLSVNLKGIDIPRSPELSATIGAQYSWPWGAHEFYLGGEWIYRDEQFSTIEDATYLQTSGVAVLADNTMPAVGANVIGNIPDRSNGFPFINPDYHLVNLRAGLIWNESLEFTVYVNNLFDEEYYTGAGENFGLSGFRLRPHPRYIGGAISYSFGGI